jgi:hypothetical protein
VVRTAAGLHRHYTGPLLGKELSHLAAAQLFAQDWGACGIGPVNLKNVFGQIQADCCNLHVGRSFSFKW